MEAILGADDFGAEVAERYGWINRALPDADLDAFVARLARRIASFPADAVRSAKRVLNELTLPGADAIRGDARRFHQLVTSETAQGRTAAYVASMQDVSLPGHKDLARPAATAAIIAAAAGLAQAHVETLLLASAAVVHERLENHSVNGRLVLHP